jgi:hypothetical protein
LIDVAEGRDKCEAFVNMATSLRVLKSAGGILLLAEMLLAMALS